MNNRVKPKMRLLFLYILIVVFTFAITINPLITISASASLSLRPIRRYSPLIAKPIIGISYGDTLVWDSPNQLAQTLNDAVAVGITSIRLDLSWDDIQHNSADTFNWTNFDRVVQAALSRHLTLLPILAYTPAWARPLGCTTPKCAPTNPYAFASFSAAASTRYAPQGIHIWEIWNEPNIVAFWQPTPNVSQYVNLVNATSKAIKAVDSLSFIVSGGLAPTATSDGNIAKLDFINAFANHGGISLVDAIGDHPYSFPVPPAYKAVWNAWQNMASIERILVAQGAANKKIWITEYGAPTNGPGVGATPTKYGIGLSPDHVNEALQAQMANDSVHLARSSSYIGALYWYSYKDLGTNKSDTENFFGLRRFNGFAKPAWYVLQKAIAATN